MKWTPAMLNTLYLEANAVNRWRGWTEVARDVSRVHRCDVSASAARQAYYRDSERYRRKVRHRNEREHKQTR